MAPHCRLQHRIVANNQLFANPRISHITDLRRETPIELRAWLRVLKWIARSTSKRASEQYWQNSNLARSTSKQDFKIISNHKSCSLARLLVERAIHFRPSCSGMFSIPTHPHSCYGDPENLNRSYLGLGVSVCPNSCTVEKRIQNYIKKV